MTESNQTPNQDDQYALDHGRAAAARKDAKARSADKHYATSSELVSHQQAHLTNQFTAILKEWFARSIAPGANKFIQGPNLELRKMLLRFTSAADTPPEFNEISQPELGLHLVSHICMTCILDNVYVVGRRWYEIRHLKSHIATMLEMETWRRAGILAETTSIEDAFRLYGTKRGSSLEYRFTNIKGFVNRKGDDVPQRRNYSQAALALIELAVNTNILQTSESAKSVSLSDYWKRRFDKEPERLGYSLATSLPLTQPPLDWRFTDAPDCFNSTGGFDDRRRRLVSPLGHGKHRDYRTISSRKAIGAVNKAQRTKFKLDRRVADFIQALVGVLTTEKYPDLCSPPAYTEDDIKHGTGAAALIPAVQNRIKGIELIPDKKQRNSEEGKQQLRTELGVDWKKNNTTLTKLYEKARDDLRRFERTARLSARLTELKTDRYADGFYWAQGLDHRTRHYLKADMGHIQSSGPERHSLVFAEGEIEPNLDVIYVAIGSAWAGTKISDDERLKVGKELLPKFIEFGSDLFANRHELLEADDFWMAVQLASGCYSHFDLGMPWDVPIFIDATQSAIQFWSSITNNVELMAACNLAPAHSSDAPADAYSAVKEGIKEVLKDKELRRKLAVTREQGRAKARPLTPKEYRQILKALQLRAGLKNSVLTALYGSTWQTRAADLRRILEEEFGEQGLPINLARTAARILDKAIMLKFGRLFAAMKLVKQVARTGLMEQLHAWEPDEDFTPAPGPRGKPELSAEELSDRIKLIQELSELDHHENTFDQITELERQLKEQERLCTKDNLKHRITDNIAREWRKDVLCRRAYDWWQKEDEAKQLTIGMRAWRAGCTLHWITPDGCHIGVREPVVLASKAVKVGVLPAIRLRESEANTISIADICRAAAPSLIHSLDATLLRKIILKLDCQIAVIHDSVGVPSNKIPELKKAVADGMAEIIGSDGRQILHNYINDVITDEETKEKLLIEVNLQFNPMPDGTNYKDLVKDARYAWN